MENYKEKLGLVSRWEEPNKTQPQVFSLVLTGENAVCLKAFCLTILQVTVAFC